MQHCQPLMSITTTLKYVLPGPVPSPDPAGAVATHRSTTLIHLNSLNTMLRPLSTTVRPLGMTTSSLTCTQGSSRLVRSSPGVQEMNDINTERVLLLDQHYHNSDYITSRPPSGSPAPLTTTTPPTTSKHRTLKQSRTGSHHNAIHAHHSQVS